MKMEEVNRIGRMILGAWKERRPKAVREMEREGSLEKLLVEAQERAGDQLWELQNGRKKMDYSAAMEIVLEDAAGPMEDREEMPQPSRHPNRQRRSQPNPSRERMEPPPPLHTRK